jgi:molybdopterin synthase sulfur carrier subunit
MIKILYFASLRESLGIAEETLSFVPADLTSLLKTLQQRHGHRGRELLLPSRVLCAVDQVMVDLNDSTLVIDLSVSKEIAFFPPVTGG